MITRLQLRHSAHAQVRDAKALVDRGSFKNAHYMVGYAVEFILKARICVDLGLAGWPDTPQEFDAATKSTGKKAKELKVHKPDELLALTSIASTMKALSEWSTVIRWTVDERYLPVGTISQATADEMIRATEIVIRAVTSAGVGLESVVVPQVAGPYTKLWALEQELSVEFGDFSLFAVWHREDSLPCAADVVIAAPWIDPGTRIGAKEVTERVIAALTEKDRRAITGVIALENDHPIVKAVCSFAGVRHSKDVAMVGFEYKGLQFTSALIFTAKRTKLGDPLDLSKPVQNAIIYGSKYN